MEKAAMTVRAIVSSNSPMTTRRGCWSEVVKGNAPLWSLGIQVPFYPAKYTPERTILSAHRSNALPSLVIELGSFSWQ